MEIQWIIIDCVVVLLGAFGHCLCKSAVNILKLLLRSSTWNRIWSYDVGESKSNWKTEKLRTRSYVHSTKCIILPPSLLLPPVVAIRMFNTVNGILHGTLLLCITRMRERFSIKIVSHSKIKLWKPHFCAYRQPAPIVQHGTYIFN